MGGGRQQNNVTKPKTKHRKQLLGSPQVSCYSTPQYNEWNFPKLKAPLHDDFLGLIF